MGVLFEWWLLAEALGFITLPLAAVVFANLPDRGWGLARPFGLLALGWLVWFPLSLITALPYSRGWIAGTLIVLALGNAALLWRWPAVRVALGALARREWGYLVANELVFAEALALMGWLRSFTPAVVDQEKFMDVAFFSAIWRAPHLPPPDPWLAGWPINYYYFGHYLVATLAKLLGTAPAIAFNASVALIFALIASAVFAVATNLAAALRPTRAAQAAQTPRSRPMLARAIPYGLVSVAFVLILGNLNAAQQWWTLATTAAKQAPRTLGSPWAWWLHPNLWLQFNWWDPSRVVPNTINEFPAFSFILSDLHAHVLALPFDAVALGAALSLLLARGEGLRAFGVGLPRALALGGTAIVFGALYAINGWDLPTYLGLGLLALACQQWIVHGRRASALFWLDLAAPGILLTALAVLLFTPFYRGYLSPAGGIGPVPTAARSPIGDEVGIFGLPLFLAGSLLVLRLGAWLADWRAARVLTTTEDGDEAADPAEVRVALRGPARTLVLAVALLLAVWTAITQGFADWTLLWGLLFIAGGVWLALWPLVPRWSPAVPRPRERAELLLWCLVVAAAALIAICELIYLRDAFDGGDLFRMNTVFKLYYQAWLLLGVAGGPMLAVLLPAARANVDWLFAWLSGTASTLVQRVRAAAPAVSLARSVRAAPLGAPAVDLAGGRGAPTPAGRRNVAATRATGASGSSAASNASGAAVNAEPASEALRPSPIAATGLRWTGAGGTLIWMVALLALVGATVVYPMQAAAARTVNFSLPRSLDGTAYMAGDPFNVGDAAAIAWLNDPAHVAGDPVIVEATGGEYSHYGRVSAFTGLPTILGWGGHEYQWRATWLRDPVYTNELDRRTAAINTIYTNTDPRAVLSALEQYHVRFVYVGAAERLAYPTADLGRFAHFLRTVYHADGVTIYAVP